ncbi:MAG: PAS domain S-box protein [Sedimenticolaceae bacterium]
MNAPSGALKKTGRPFVSSNLWVPLLLIVLACAAIAYYGYEVVNTLERSVAANARAQGQATAHEITAFIGREQERLQAFVAEKDEEIRKILSFPDDWPAIDALQGSLRRMFRGALAFSITGADGKPLFEDFEGLVGLVCQASMREYAQSMGRQPEGVAIPPIHPVPGAYHFDLISPWQLDAGDSGLFFVSMSPGRLAEIIDAAEHASGNRIFLVNSADTALIEVSAAGARDVLGEDIRLDADDMVPGYFSADLPGTGWRLLVLPDGEALAAAVDKVYINVAALILALLVISAALLLVIRRFEQRNSSLFMRSLQSSVSRQRAILQSMVDGMVTIDARGRILNVNNAVTRLFGYEQKELVGSNVRMLMPDPDRSAHDGYLRNYLETGNSKILGSGREVMARRKDGSLFPVLLTLGESVEGDERIFVGILHDMSAYNDAQRKIVAQSLAIERSNQELEEISQIASKDLQLPLQRITMLGATLESEFASSLSGSEKARLRVLAEDARNMSEVVKGLVDYTRVKPEPTEQQVDLDRVLQEVQEDLATVIADTGARLSVGPLGMVSGNRKQLRQVFWNLVENAVKFRDPTRVPEIDVSLATDSDLPADADPDQVTVLVRDNGMGIPEDQLDPIFEAFHRLHPRDAYPGAGLGLSFCRKIVERMGGHICAESRLGEGSTFRVTLPRALPG